MGPFTPIANTQAATADAAAGELAGQMGTPPAGSEQGIVLCFASPQYDPEALATALSAAIPAPVYGCTTAGEIGPRGFASGSAVAVWLRPPGMRFGVALVERVSRLDFAAGRGAIERAAAALATEVDRLDSRRHFVLLLCDGLSGAEETLAASIAAAAPELTCAGGSAGDGRSFGRCLVFAGGHAHEDAALVIAAHCPYPFSLIKTEHMEPTELRVVVTRADPGRRLVLELDGRPARIEYARLLGIGREEVTLERSSSAPFACYIGGVPYVRSVSGVEGDGLRFACAVGEGVVLRLMRPGDLVATTRRALRAAVSRVGGQAQAILAFHCLGRFIEAESRRIVGDLEEVFADFPLVGFNTYGEQCNGLHVNHSLTGVAIGGGGGGTA